MKLRKTILPSLVAISAVAVLPLLSCVNNSTQKQPEPLASETESIVAGTALPDTLVDCHYSFDEAVAGSKAPQSVIARLELIDVTYLSTDGKMHKGQIVTNREIAEDLQYMFRFMAEQGFVVEKAIPAVRYDWSDSLSMDDNNTYSFCYRNVSYSKHAQGMAIDINPRFNPLRQKRSDRPNQPAGAVSDTTANGTFYPGHPVVEAFRRRGFRWGHTFSKYWDDHHFEKR